MPRLRVTVGGALGTLSDWSNTFEFLLGGTAPNQAQLQTAVNAMLPNIGGVSAVKNALCTDTTVASVKALYYPTNTGTSSLVAVSSGTSYAGLAAPTHAPQVCVVASLRTALAGRSYRGRSYVPYRGPGVSATGVVNSTTQGVIATYAQTCASAIASAITGFGGTGSWVVWSPKNGTGSPINAILVGTQCDTIRHRNRNRAESYSSTTVTPSVVEADTPEEVEQINTAVNALIHGVKIDGPTGLGDTIGLIAGAVLSA